MLLVDLEAARLGFRFDIRYARTDNFMGRVVYPTPGAFLLKHVGQDLYKVHEALKPHGFGILFFDGYRPWSVTKLFWDESNTHDRQFLANPENGSSHNRGCAVDLSMFYLDSGRPAEMPSDFDEMNEKAYATYPGGAALERQNRDLLKAKMNEFGFEGIQHEWWHFNHTTHENWPVMNFSFEEIGQAPRSLLPLFR